MSLAPVCILAGGLGTRLGERVRDTPKPLIEVAGRPFLEHQLALLREYGAHRVVLCVGYLGERIEAALGDGARYGLELRYRYDPPDLAGTAGAVRAALDDLGERFLVLYGDTYLRIDYRAVQVAAAGEVALMTVLENGGRWDASNAALRRRPRVLRQAPADAGHALHRLRPSVLTPTALEGGEADLADVLHRLSVQGRLAGYLRHGALLRDRHRPGPGRDRRLPQWKSFVRSSKKLATVTHAATPKKTTNSGPGSSVTASVVTAYWQTTTATNRGSCCPRVSWKPSSRRKTTVRCSTKCVEVATT